VAERPPTKNIGVSLIPADGNKGKHGNKNTEDRERSRGLVSKEKKTRLKPILYGEGEQFHEEKD